MIRRGSVQRERTLEQARALVAEVRRDLERATAAGCDVPPRLRTVHSRPGHATPEYRTLAIPAPPGTVGASPDMLSAMIARYAAARPPVCMLLALDGFAETGEGAPQPILIAEARDVAGTRLFWMQPFRAVDGKLEWGEPVGGGWQDPGEQELILDLAFASTVETQTRGVPLPEPRAVG